MCKFFNIYEESLYQVCVNLQNMLETALFSGKIYTANKNFRRQSVKVGFGSSGIVKWRQDIAWDWDREMKCLKNS